MPQIINTNIASLNAQRNLNRTQGALEISLQRLSSGLRINSAKDDAAGLAISERFTTQIRGLNQAIRNANDGISFAQVAEGALSTVGDSLQRIREIAVQAINDTNSPADRQALNNEVQQLLAEVNRVASSTQFNGQNILDGSLGDLTFQVGANQGQTVTATGVDARGMKLGADTATGIHVRDTQLNLITSVSSGLSINTVAVDLTAVKLDGDADTLVNAINAVANDSGVQASQSSSLAFDLTAFVNPGVAGSVAINGVDIVYAGSDTAVEFAAAINLKTGQTGVSAVSTSATELTLTSAFGADVTLVDFDDLGLSDSYGVLTPAEVVQAGVILAAPVGSGVDPNDLNTSIVVAGADDALAGLDEGTQLSNARNILNDVNVLTGNDADAALATIDYALQAVSGFRSELGAVQIRFEATISNLEVQSENTSAARSRILDADFAAETAALTRATILQQAGISVLAQANALPQQVLALLQ